MTLLCIINARGDGHKKKETKKIEQKDKNTALSFEKVLKLLFFVVGSKNMTFIIRI